MLKLKYKRGCGKGFNSQLDDRLFFGTHLSFYDIFGDKKRNDKI